MYMYKISHMHTSILKCTCTGMYTMRYKLIKQARSSRMTIKSLSISIHVHLTLSLLEWPKAELFYLSKESLSRGWEKVN